MNWHDNPPLPETNPCFAWVDPQTDARLSVKFPSIQDANEHPVRGCVLMRCDAGEWTMVSVKPLTTQRIQPYVVRVVHDSAECGAWGDIDHLAIEGQVYTLCGRAWDKATTRQSLKDTSERTPCHRCRTQAEVKLVASMKAGRVLARMAGLDYSAIERRSHW